MVKIRASIFGLVAATQLLLSQGSSGAVTGYQVTGPILEVTDKVIVVQKGDEKWAIARDENTNVKGDLKVGQKVTIHYKMTATSVENKSGASDSKAVEVSLTPQVLKRSRRLKLLNFLPKRLQIR